MDRLSVDRRFLHLVAGCVHSEIKQVTAGALLARRLLAGPVAVGGGEPADVDELVLSDLAAPAPDLAANPRVETATVDLAAEAGALGRADVIFHLAGVVSGAAEADFDLGMRTNLDGTRAVLDAARSAGVPRTVHTSSVAAIGVRAGGAAADETHQSDLAKLVGTYKRSKFLAEQEVRRAVDGGQDVVIVNPTTPVGPWDAKPTPTGEIVVRFLNRRMPAYVDTGLNVVDVREVVELASDYLEGALPRRRAVCQQAMTQPHFAGCVDDHHGVGGGLLAAWQLRLAAAESRSER